VCVCACVLAAFIGVINDDAGSKCLKGDELPRDEPRLSMRIRGFGDDALYKSTFCIT